MTRPIPGLVARAWLGPGLAALLLLGLGLGTGLQLPEALIGLVVAASVIVGAPAAVLVAQTGAVLGVLRLALPVATLLGVGGAWLLGLEGLGLVGAGLGATGLAVLWMAGGAAPGRLAWPIPLAALGAAGLLLALRPEPTTMLVAAGLGAAILGLALLMPLALVPRGLRGGGNSILLGLMLAGAVLAGPASGVAVQEQVLGLLVAIPGLGLLVAAPLLAPFRLGLVLLAVQALVTFLALLIPGAAAALGLLPAEALGDFRWALLGAGFLPVFCALAAALLPGRAGLFALGGFALLAGGLPLAIGAIGLLAAPILAILLATVLLLMGGDRDVAGT